MFRICVNNQKLREAHEEAREGTGEGQGGEGYEAELQKALGQYEQMVQSDMESSGDRPTAHEALNHLIVGGNVLLYDNLDAGKPMRVFPLTRYVINRDPMGAWVELVIHEKVSPQTLPDDTRQKILDAMSVQQGDASTESSSSDTFVDVYTHVTREGGKYKAYQECRGEVIDGTDAEYPLDGCPFIPLRMYRVAGEDYGRSYVENYLGDLKSLEALTQAVIEGSAVSSKVVFLVNPNGTTKAVDLQKLPNGGIGTGNAADVTTVQVQKTADLGVAYQAVEMLNARLAKAFMLMDGIRRDAERVTAEEIRAMAEQLEASHGGLYSLLSQEYQLPYVQRRIFRLVKSGKLSKLPGDDVKITIVTGFEALGRGNDKTKLVGFIQTLAQTLGPEAVLQYLNPAEFISRLATADGIDTKGLIKTGEEIAAEQQQAQQQRMMESLGPEAVKAMASGGFGQQKQSTTEEPIQGEM